VEKAAVFVDAGYLLAASAELVTGSKTRAAIEVNYPALLSALIDFAEHHSELQVLRLYWYDGARLGVPTPDQLQVAHRPRVKLRLGRKTYYGQKGVDALIVLDLITLARERAMSAAYLISGDEDIREGVAAAQQMGVRVVLLGVPGRYGNPHQADTLVREADERVVLDRQLMIEAHIKPTPPPPAPAAPAVAAQPAVAATVQPQSAPAAPTPPSNGAGAQPVSAREIGKKFGADWASQATGEEMEALRAKVPTIPREIDAQLFRYAETSLGPMRERYSDRYELRAGFWDAIMKPEPTEAN
jgi:uncharacterized LabA/DUF88 family protein